jgi:polar amino acid transport system substrate-binding protein
MTEFIAVIDLDGKIVSINKSFTEHLKLPIEETLNFKYVEIFDDCFNAHIPEIIDRTVETGEKIEKEVSCKSEIYLMKTFLLKEASENHRNILLTIENITSEKLAKNQMLQANKMAAIGQLAAGVAHEIRNPLGIIRNHSYVMNTLYKDEKGQKSLKYIDSAVKRANKIIDNLLEFSRISGNEQTLVDLEKLINDIIEFENKNMIKMNIEHKLYCERDLKCYTYKEALKHILINLVSNAIDAMENGGVLSVLLEIRNELLYIEVRDTGCGIPESEMEKIFNPFYTTKDVGKGTGLGLYIAYSEVKKLHGDIKVNSILGENTAFEVKLPIKVRE